MSLLEKRSFSGLHWWGQFIVVTSALFLGFFANSWGVVSDSGRFRAFQKDSESLVMARLAESRRTSLVSHNALLGWVDADPLNLSERDYQHQYDVYLSGRTFGTFAQYKSSSGGQALVLGLLDKLSPFTPASNLDLFHAVVAALFAATLALFVAWIGREFGVWVALFVGATTILSQWLTLFGRNLFYFIWASFLPLVVAAYFFRADSQRATAGGWRPVLAVSAVLFLKCLLNGFDFILPALAMPFVLIAYYARLGHWPWHKLLSRAGRLLTGVAAAVTLSVLVLAAQLSTSEGSLRGGLTSVLNTLGRRTFFVDATRLPDYAAIVQQTSGATVLWTYLSQDWAVEAIGLRFLDLIAICSAITAAHLVLQELRPSWVFDPDKSSALIVATWISLIAPIAWFLLFKGQAVVHTHTNYLAWHMPFTFFAYALIAALAKSIGLALRHRRALGPPAT